MNSDRDRGYENNNGEDEKEESVRGIDREESENITRNDRGQEMENEVNNEGDGLGGINEEPSQPKMKQYPRDKSKRCFLKDWFSQYKWLEYLKSEDKAYCYACRHYSTGTGRAEHTFTETGFSCWKNGVQAFKKQDLSQDHLLSITRWETLRKQKNNQSLNIENMIDPNRISVVAQNREYIKMIFKFHQYFCTSELSYHGHDQSADSLNAGKWLEFIHLTLDTNTKFKELHQKCVFSIKAVTIFHLDLVRR